MPPIEHLVEAGIYADDLDRAEAFYREVVGLDVLGTEPGRHVFFRVGNSVPLVFRPEATLKGDFLPPHGAEGPGHFALGIPTESLDEWRKHLADHGIEIIKSGAMAFGTCEYWIRYDGPSSPVPGDEGPPFLDHHRMILVGFHP